MFLRGYVLRGPLRYGGPWAWTRWWRVLLWMHTGSRPCPSKSTAEVATPTSRWSTQDRGGDPTPGSPLTTHPTCVSHVGSLRGVRLLLLAMETPLLGTVGVGCKSGIFGTPMTPHHHRSILKSTNLKSEIQKSKIQNPKIQNRKSKNPKSQNLKSQILDPKSQNHPKSWKSMKITQKSPKIGVFEGLVG